MPSGKMRGAKESNDEYVESWAKSQFYGPLREAHDLLSHFIPGYQIVMIEERFGRVWFRYVLPVDLKDVQLYRKLAEHIVGWLTVRCEIAALTGSIGELPSDEEE